MSLWLSATTLPYKTSIPDEIRQLKERMSVLENLCNENLKAVNDLSEDTRRDIDSV
ncbi:hypothetical protein Barb6XT_03117 [Bacteroidales bacterium Barb6XT]|nr:hypothetical protein Barb6XT_03117 [Bacteroidales bacterium Barb6XT]